MKIKLILLLVTTSFSIDVCVQFTKHQSCVQYQNEQCRWYGEYCRKSNDYLLGCDANIGVKLCVKQFGTLDGEVAECIFDKYCHTIYDKHTIHCTDQLSKSGCLSITNPNEFCKWENGQCQNLKVDELNQIQDTFDQKLLSASVCSQINGFLIIHNSVLWGLIGYKPELFKEAENLAKIEAGIEVDTTTSYDQTAQLQDNYIDKNGKFQRYSTTTQLTISNGRINDYTRYGCIAQEILTDLRFLTLFSLSGIIRGVNHVYCSYFPVHPSSPSLTVFINNECIPITQLQLKTQEVIEKLNIQCSNLSRIPCQLYYNRNEKCKINIDSEYECQSVNTIKEQAICSSNLKEDTHYTCVNSKSDTTYCYLQVSSFSANCSSSCSNKSTSSECQNDSYCYWLLGDLDSSGISDYKFKACVPISKCNQEGLNELYCKQMAANCYWKDDETRCVSIDRIEQFNCSNCNQMYCCSSVVRYDQFCIWKSNENLCLNVKDQQLFSHFQSFPTNVIMNKNLCVYQVGQFNYYNEVSRTCETKLIDLYKLCIDYNADDLDVDEVDCNNLPNDTINKDGCLALLNSFTKWNYFTQKCQYIVNRNKPCDEMKVVNPNVCQYAQVATGKICLYNLETQSCQIVNDNVPLFCNTLGINEEKCLGLNEQHCQWINKICYNIKDLDLTQKNCYELTKVSAGSCQYPVNQSQKCKYDKNILGCVIAYNTTNILDPPEECTQHQNQYACQASSGTCYFNNVLNQCESSIPYLNELVCEGQFISESTCLLITTPGQRCKWSQWIDQCYSYTPNFFFECFDWYTYSITSNINVCEAYKSTSLILLVYQDSCEFTDNKCFNSTHLITNSDCGYFLRINGYRCMSYTTQECYFSNYKCQPINQQQEYKEMILTYLTCEQSNVQVCNQILTPGQACYKISELQCMLYLSLVDTCENLDFNILGADKYSPNLCIRANNECYYDFLTKNCKKPDPTEIFDCTQTGVSYLLCLKQTRGACVFVTNFCQPVVDYLISCEHRNKKACTLGGLNCVWDSSTKECKMSPQICPSVYDNGSNWPICSIGLDDCYAGENGCINVAEEQVTNLPCWLSLNQSLCEKQETFCQWLDDKCQYKDYKCENANTFNECVQHKSLNCVYDNNKCFEVSEIHEHSCDEFQYTSLNYCRGFSPFCKFSLTYQCLQSNFFENSVQTDSELAVYGCLGLSPTQNNCIFQRILPCQLSYNSLCQTPQFTRTECFYWDVSTPISILFCEQLPDCQFSITSYGEPFCHSSPLNCESFSPRFCLNDIPNIKCYIKQINGTDTCQTFSDAINCDSIQGLQVNLQLCLEASKNSSQKCYYYSSQSLCKKVINTATDITLNSCVQTLDQQFYDLKSHQCNQFNNIQNYDDIYYCFQFNQKACTSSVNELFCIWEENQCKEQQIEDYVTECSSSNHKACLNANKDCIWDVDSYSCSDQSSSLCNNCEYSEYHCIKNNQLWNGRICYSIQTDLPVSFFRCDNLGLNESQCLNNTLYLFCFWNGFKCKESNLKMLKCTDKVSKQTCLNIKTNNQICNWQNDECVSVKNSLNCNDYLTLQNCRDAKISCEYNLGHNQCQVQNRILQICSNTLSYGACSQVLYQSCQWNENQCQMWYRTRFSCDNIINEWGCMNSIMHCKWADDKCEDIKQTKLPCLNIPQNFNKVSCQKLAVGPCRYDEDLKKCNINLTSDYEDSLQIIQTGYLQIRLIYECNQFTNQYDCIGSRIGYCEWKDGYCLNCEQNQNCAKEGCHNKSLKQCLSMSNDLCAWRNNSCIEWNVNVKVNLQELTLVTEKCCSVINKEIKYNIVLKSCSSIDYELDDCSTPGLSEYACLRIVKFQCVYSNGQCSEFNFSHKGNCEQYQNVTQAVCQNLQHLSCKYDNQNHKCISLNDSDNCNSTGLSVLGCTSIKITPCYWDKNLGACSDFIVDPGLNQCDDVTKRNSLSCSQLNYHLDFCSFNIENRTCHQKFNPNSKCSYPGLNQLACVSLTLEPCIYKINKCQKLSNLYVSCNVMQNVNEIACKLNQLDICSYDSISNNCLFSLSVLPCNYKGINSNNCKTQPSCQWSYDDQQCTCKSQQTQNSCQLEESICKNTSYCFFDFELQMCRSSNCNNLLKCEGSINGFSCYLNDQQECQNAKKCEDIINLDKSYSCSDFLFNNSNCITQQNNCLSATNLQSLCVNSDCSNSSCIMENSLCRPLQCSDYLESSCYDHNNCSFINNKCQYIDNCSKITDQQICEYTTVENRKCSWQMYGIYENTKHCTNNYCFLYMASSTLCNGNEINQYSCYMDQFLQCRQCEEITDRCTCENSNGACRYDEGECRSILCQMFNTENACVASKKCYWSSVDMVCRKFCKQLILEEDCEALNYECHWNPYQYKCENGVEVIPDLSVKIIVQDISCKRLVILMLVILLL